MLTHSCDVVKSVLGLMSISNRVVPDLPASLKAAAISFDLVSLLAPKLHHERRMAVRAVVEELHEPTEGGAQGVR